MSFTHKPGSGALFLNQFKEGNQPDFKGDGTVETTCPHCQAPFVVALWLSGWRRFTQKNDAFTSLAIKDKTRDGTFKKVGDYDSPPRPTQGQVYDEPVKRGQLTDEDLDDIVPF